MIEFQCFKEPLHFRIREIGEVITSKLLSDPGDHARRFVQNRFEVLRSLLHCKWNEPLPHCRFVGNLAVPSILQLKSHFIQMFSKFIAMEISEEIDDVCGDRGSCFLAFELSFECCCKRTF